MKKPGPMTAKSCLRWLWMGLTAVVLLQVGVRLGQRRNADKVGLAQSLQAQRGRATDTASITTRPLDHHAACSDAAIVPLNPTCPRQLVVNYLTSAGFGHQFTELFFGMYAAQYLGLTFTWNAIETSDDHGDDYTSLVKTLGLERFFVEGLGLATAKDLRELRKTTPRVFGQWIEVGNSEDKRRFVLEPPPCNNSVVELEGWWHCRGVADNNCFWAPEHQFLFQRYGKCLRAGVEAYGKVNKRCVLLSEDQVFLPRDTLVVVWHLRFGDVTTHKPGDAFFTNVIQALKQVVSTKGLIKRVRIVLVGGGKGMSHVPEEYVEGLRGVVNTVVGTESIESSSSPPQFYVERFHNNNNDNNNTNTSSSSSSLFEDQFLAMMQADVLIGSGSSVPQVAALLSATRPLFFDHVAKHGYGYGQEATADSVDMDENGRVLDSLRRVRLMLFERIATFTGPCRDRRIDTI